VLQTDSPAISSRYGTAIQWALSKHLTQVRHNTLTPYISHLLITSGIVLEEGADEDVAIAALLHDVLEDQSVNPNEIRELFGERVLQIVVDCTDATKSDRREISWRERKLQHLERMEMFSHDTLLVIAADKISSLQSLMDDILRFGLGLFRESKQSPSELMWHYTESYKVISRRLDGRAVVVRLGRLVDEAQEILGRPF
jgi:(p)ppGpp synthase/HD superfamily hydrolase